MAVFFVHAYMYRISLRLPTPHPVDSTLCEDFCFFFIPIAFFMCEPSFLIHIVAKKKRKNAARFMRVSMSPRFLFRLPPTFVLFWRVPHIVILSKYLFKTIHEGQRWWMEGTGTNAIKNIFPFHSRQEKDTQRT